MVIFYIGGTILISLLLTVLFRLIARVQEYYSELNQNGGTSIFFKSFERSSIPESKRVANAREDLEKGEIFVRDFRQPENRTEETTHPDSLRIVSLNMEMGKKIDKIISDMRALDPHILCLQEVDVNTKRTGYLDTVGELAKALNMISLFAVEVIMEGEGEGEGEGSNKRVIRGYQGNAILSKYDFLMTEGITLECARYPQQTHRRKTHCEPRALINSPLGIIDCYTAHLDPNHTGIERRAQQYLDLMEQVRLRQDQHPSPRHVVVTGDLNTLCHGLARLVPKAAPDWHSRFGTLGLSEAEAFQVHAVEKANKKFGLQLRDPFDKKKDTTFTIRGIYSGKLDWCLLSPSLSPLTWKVCPENDQCSDHQWVLVSVEKA